MNARMFSNKEEMKKEAARRLILARSNAGFRSASAAAKQFGWKSTYGAHENGTNGFSPADAQKYGVAFNVNWHWLMLVSESMEPETELQPARLQAHFSDSPREDVPVFDAAAGGSGHLIVSTDPSEFVEAPPILRNIKGVYGIRVTGDSMAPDYADGSIAFANPASGKRTGRTHIFYDHDPKTGEAQAIIKTLVGQTETKWKVAQTNPAKTFTLNKVDWPICHFVAASYN
ncbi:MAG: S24 family peptidase [Xanthobacteraceae bacterium]